MISDLARDIARGLPEGQQKQIETAIANAQRPVEQRPRASAVRAPGRVRSMMRVENEVPTVLSRAATQGNALTLFGQLDRRLYDRTNKVLEAAGGKWNRSEISPV